MPEKQKATRKLTAILSADVKGYSLLMADDEAYTIRKLEEYRIRMSNLIRANSGRVVDAVGDNLLAEFSSAVDAVHCAVEIQKALKEKNAEIPENKRLNFRIGVNIGDVVQDGARIYGSGVNIAARIEGIADAGGVCISRNVFEQIKDKLTLGYEYLGDHSVKNIKDPVRVYKLLMADEDAGKLIGNVTKPVVKNWIWAAIVVGAVVITAAVFTVYQKMAEPDFEPASVKKMALPLPDKPSIAVLPFDNLSDSPEQEYFCDGLTEEIISALSSVPKIFVIARNSTFTYKNKPVRVQQVSEELGVRYVLEGSVRKGGDEIRITAQLVDAVNGFHVWAERYDKKLDDIFYVQDEITKKIISAMQVKLTEGEEVSVAAKGTNNLQAYLKYLQANELIYKHNPQDNALAKKLANEAIALDIAYASAYYVLSKSYMLDVWLGTAESPKSSLTKAMQLLQKAIALDNDYADAYVLLGYLFSMTGQHDEALANGKKAIAINPNSAEAHMRYGKILTFAGKYQESILELETAIRLNPIPPNVYLYSLGISYCWTEQYEKAVEWCERAVREEPNGLFARLFMAMAYSLSGRDAEARTEAAEVIRIHPNFSLKKFNKSCTYKNKSDCERIADALRKAGLPETPLAELPDKPSIAVLPFDNLSDDPEQEYFSDGLTQFSPMLICWTHGSNSANLLVNL